MGSTAGQLTFLNHTVLHQEVCISLLFAFPLCLRHRHTHPHTHACARAPSPVLSIPVLFVLFVGVCLSQPLCTLQGISAKSLLSELSAHMETHTQITRAVTLTRVCACVASVCFHSDAQINHQMLPVAATFTLFMPPAPAGHMTQRARAIIAISKLLLRSKVEQGQRSSQGRECVRADAGPGHVHGQGVHEPA